MFDNIQELIDTISLLRDRKDHQLLSKLEDVLRASIEDVTSMATDISQAQVWLRNLTDILLGPDKEVGQGKRDTERYKQEVDSKTVRGRMERYIFYLLEKVREKEKGKGKEGESEIGMQREKQQVDEKYSEFLKDFIEHLRKTYYNWKEHLFTCYDHKHLPNTNLELELAHSRMKRKHRKITGLKNSHKFLSIHGEHFAFCFDFESSYESFMNILQSADCEKVKLKSRKELLNSRQRGQNKLTLKNLPQRFENMIDEWGNS